VAVRAACWRRFMKLFSVKLTEAGLAPGRPVVADHRGEKPPRSQPGDAAEPGSRHNPGNGSFLASPPLDQRR